MGFALSLPRLVLGTGAITGLAGELAALGIKRPLLVSDAGLARLGHVERVAGQIGTRHAVFTDVPENPTSAGVEAALAAYSAGTCDAIVALGGGSVIDTGKLVAVLAAQGGRPADYLGYPGRVKAAAPIVVIPTTAGTGSDSSPDAGIHPDANSLSSGITSRHVVPRLALCDPELTRTLPPGLTAATGLDAISHCVEGFLAKGDNPLADAIALDGLSRAWLWIEKATHLGADLEARGHMMLAAFEGGIAIAKGLGPAHAIAISCGDQGLHHGRLSALGLLATMEFARETQPAKYRALGQAVGLDDIHRGLRALMRRLGLPVTLGGLGYRAASLDALALACAESHFNLTAPVAPGVSQYREMLTSILE